MFAPQPFSAAPRPAFGSAKQHLADTPKKRARLTTKADRKYHLAARSAAELFPALPNPGTSIHTLMLGMYDLCQVVVAVTKLCPTIRHLRIATLCYNRRNAKELLALVDARKDMRLTLLVSTFFVSHNKEGHESTVAELGAYPNVQIATARSHAKVVCFDLGDKDGLVFEGSANLRANRDREQLTVFRDRGLHDFHAQWIDELVKAHGQVEDATESEGQAPRTKGNGRTNRGPG